VERTLAGLPEPARRAIARIAARAARHAAGGIGACVRRGVKWAAFAGDEILNTEIWSVRAKEK